MNSNLTCGSCFYYRMRFKGQTHCNNLARQKELECTYVKPGIFYVGGYLDAKSNDAICKRYRNDKEECERRKKKLSTKRRHS